MARLHRLHRARAALEQDFLPDTISSDLTAATVDDPGNDIPHLISKFMALGLGLTDALRMVTAAPARALLPDFPVGRLAPELPADLAVLRLERGEFEFRDAFGHTVLGAARLVSVATIKDGVVLDPRPSTENIPG